MHHIYIGYKLIHVRGDTLEVVGMAALPAVQGQFENKYHTKLDNCAIIFVLEM